MGYSKKPELAKADAVIEEVFDMCCNCLELENNTGKCAECPYSALAQLVRRDWAKLRIDKSVAL
jgi:hypothetical protein